MFSTAKRSWLKAAAFAAVAVLAACGKEEPPPPKAVAPAAAARPPRPRRAAQDRLRLREPDRRRRLDVPARHRPQGDGGGARRQGQDQVHRERARGRRRRARDPRARAQGNKLIFTTSFGYMNPTIKVAPSSRTSSSSTPPATRPRRTSASTTRSFYEGAYLAGIVAGKMTKTGTLGYVAAFPIPEVLGTSTRSRAACAASTRRPRQGRLGQLAGSTRRRSARRRSTLHLAAPTW